MSAPDPNALTVIAPGVRLVVFDMAGTTVYDGDAVHRCLGDALAAAGIRSGRSEINRVMGIAKPEAIRQLALEKPHVRDASSPDPDIFAIHADFQVRMQAHYRTSPEVRAVEGAEECFAELRAAGVRVALDTGFDRVTADTVLLRLGWLGSAHVDATVTTDEVPRGRPFPDLILRAMELCGIRSAVHVAKVGDTPADLAEGMAAGCGWVIGITSGSHTRAELAAHAHTHLIDSLSELPGLLQLQDNRAPRAKGR